MPTLGGTRPSIKSRVERLFRFSEHRPLGWIDAEGHNVELLADVHRNIAKAAHQAVENLRAKHRATVINQRQNHWFLAKVLTQLDRVAMLVLKRETWRNRIVQLLIDADIFQQFGANANILDWPLKLRCGGWCMRGKQKQDGAASEHPPPRNPSDSHRFGHLNSHVHSFLDSNFYFDNGFAPPTGFSAASPRSSTKSMARSIGIRTTPPSLSTPP